MENKSGSKAGSKTNLNESSVPLLEEQEGKDVPEKIELETKGDNNEEKKENNETKDKKGFNTFISELVFKKCFSFKQKLVIFLLIFKSICVYV